MDVYDPQTLGILVFGGFIVFATIGIKLVLTFSMKETSYQEALAKQQQDSGKTQPQHIDKKKKASEKKNKTTQTHTKQLNPNNVAIYIYIHIYFLLITTIPYRCFFF